MAEAIVLGLGGFASAGAATAALGTVGYNLAIAGVSLGLSVATSAIVSALTPLPPSPKQSILVNARDAAAPQEFVYGEVRKGGVTTYYESARKGSVLYQIIAVAAHEVESIDAIYVNDKQVTLSTDGYDNGSRSGAGWVTDDEWTSDDTEHEIRIFYHLGDQTAITDTFANSSVETLDSVFFNTGSADEDSQNFGGVGQPTKASFVGNGIAYIFVRYGFNAGVFSKGLPLITCKLKGKKVYDPRTTSTAYSNNAALCIRDYLTSAYGLNDPNVDDTVFSAAANTCDENVTLDAGGTEKRYTLNGVVTAGQSYGDVLQQMITSCGGTLFWGGGKWKLGVGEYNAPTKVLTLDDLRSNISLQTRTNLRDQFNRVQGVFADASNRYLVADYPPIESATFLAQDDGVEQTLDLDLPFTTSSATAQRLAKQVLFRGREQMVFSADFGLNAFDVEVGEIVALTVERYGWDEKEFEVVGWNFNSSSEGGDLRVSLTLRETSAAAFSWTAEESEIINNDSDLVTTLEPVGNLTATSSGSLGNDGTFLNGILVDWDSVVGSSGYEVEWTVNTSINYAANGGIVEEADAVTTRELFIYKGYLELLYRQPDQDGFDFYNTGGGSGLTEAAFRAQLAASPERASLKFSGLIVQNPTTEYTIKPALDNTIYNIRVRAINNNGVKSLWRSVTFTTGEDDSLPGVPTSFTATGSLGFINLSWVNPVDNDFQHVEVYEGPDATFSNASSIATVSGTSYSRGNLAPLTLRYYWIRSVDYTGNVSAFAGPVNATTTQITANDIGDAQVPWDKLDATVETVIDSKVDTLEASVAGTYATITTTNIIENDVDGLGAKFGVTLDVNGVITGYQILNESGSPSAFNVRADQFNLYGPTPDLSLDAAPFSVFTTPTTVNGIVYPAGVYSKNTIYANSMSVGSTTNGLRVNVDDGSGSYNNAVYAFGNQELIYALYGENTYVPPGSTAAGGAVKIRSNSGYALEIDQYGDYSGEQACAFIQNSQDIGSGPRGGAVYLGRGFTEGNYGVEVLRGGYYDTSGDGYLPFTGAHEALIPKKDKPEVGDILCDVRAIVTGISDSITEVAISSAINQSSAVGVFKGYKSSWDSIAAFVDREETTKNFKRDEADKTKKPKGKKRVLKGVAKKLPLKYKPLVMNSLGEGGVNVCGENGDIKVGDLIVTSSLPGKGMKQADDIVRSYTVAKAREDVTFSSPTEVKMVACVYLCG